MRRLLPYHTFPPHPLNHTTYFNPHKCVSYPPPLLLASLVHLQVCCHAGGFHVQQCPQNPLISL